MKYMNLWKCPNCGSATNTFRHPYAKVWCPECGTVLREEGDRTIEHKDETVKLEIKGEEIILHNGRFAWQLITSKRQFSFHGSDFADYLEELFKSKGVPVRKTGDGSEDYKR